MTTKTPQRWIVGFDGSNHARRALEWAATLAATRTVDLHVVSAWRRPYAGALPIPADSGITTTGSEIPDAINRDMKAVIEDITQAKGVAITSEAKMGGAAHVLLEAVKDADLLVVGSRGRGGFAQLVLGSVGLQTSGHSTKPTLVIPDTTRPHGLNRIIVGIDGSENAKSALRWAHEFVSHRAEIVALLAWELPYFGNDPADEALRQAGSDRAHDRLTTAIAEVEADIGVPGRFTSSFHLGHAGRHLVAEAEHADLLVVGARGGSKLLSGLGSLSTWVLHNMACPTAIVPSAQ